MNNTELLNYLLELTIWKTIEGYENYDEPSCLTLAKKNQANLDSLKKDVDTILALQSKVQSLQNTTDANSKQLKSLVDQVYKT